MQIANWASIYNVKRQTSLFGTATTFSISKPYHQIMKNKLLFLTMVLLLVSTLQAQSKEVSSPASPFHKLGFGVQTSVFPTSMYGEDELFVSVAPTITRQRGMAMSYIGLQMTPKPSGVVFGFQRTFLLIGQRIRMYYGLDAQVGKITLRLPSTCPQIELRSRNLMALGSVNLGVETVLPFGDKARWIAHVQAGIADLEVAGPCPANEVNAIGRIGLRVHL